MRIIKTYRKLSEQSIMAQAMVKAKLIKERVKLISERVENLQPKYKEGAPTKRTSTRNIVCPERPEKAPRISLKAKIYLGMLKLKERIQRASIALIEHVDTEWDNIKLSTKIIGALGRRVLVLKARLAESEALIKLN